MCILVTNNLVLYYMNLYYSIYILKQPTNNQYILPRKTETGLALYMCLLAKRGNAIINWQPYLILVEWKDCMLTHYIIALVFI